MTIRTIRLIALALLVSVFAPISLSQANSPAQGTDSAADLLQLLRSIGKFPPDPCGPPYGVDENSSDLEAQILRQVADDVARALNGSLPAPKSPLDRAKAALATLGAMSAEINFSWPEQYRLRFEMLDLPPALVLKASIRTHDRYFVFGVPEEDDSSKPNQAWRMVGSDDESGDNPFTGISLSLYPLHRGRSGNPRFLAASILSGCAGSLGVSYDAREWAPQGYGSFEQIIKQTGSFGLDDKVPGFAEIGELTTKGPLIALPYCWFSAIDTWDNPSMCAVDTYDVSDDDVRFRSRSYNRRDLLPIAKALEYAEKRDYPAVRAYCATAQVARALVREIPPFFSAEQLQVTRIGSDRERVSFGSGSSQFEVARREGRWVVTRFFAD
jgi:hypothetical protein